MSNAVRGRTRIITKAGTNYIVAESIDEIARLMQKTESVETDFIALDNVPAQTAFPPEEILVRISDISTIQGVSREVWIWEQQVHEQHYAKMLAATPQEQIAESQAELVKLLQRQAEDE